MPWFFFFIWLILGFFQLSLWKDCVNVKVYQSLQVELHFMSDQNIWDKDILKFYIESPEKTSENTYVHKEWGRMGISEDTERSVLAIPLNGKETNTMISSVLKWKLPASHGGRISWGKVLLWETEAVTAVDRCGCWGREGAGVGILSRKQERHQQLMWGPSKAEGKLGSWFSPPVMHS